MKARILWIGNKRADGPPFVTDLQKNDFVVEIVSSGPQAVERVPIFKPDLLVVNAASLHRTGKNICRFLRKKLESLPIILISNAGDVDPKDDCANVILILPFTSRKLLNRIAPFIAERVSQITTKDEKNILRAGPLSLDLKRRQVRCLDKQTRLTPRLVELLQILMQHPGDVIPRERLFQEVWSTEYLGDTRTLDVHISWLRKAIEDDPRKPRFLKTIRRVGYRLDVS